MCEPVSTTTMFYTTLAMAAAAATSQYMAASSAADAQSKYQDAQSEENARFMKENARLADEAYIEKAAQENLRMTQEGEVASQEIQQIQKQRLQKQGELVATSEGAGLSYDMLMNDFHRQEADYRGNMRRQLEMERQQSQMTIKGFRSEAEGRTASVRPYIADPISRPSLFGTGLQIGGAAVDSFTKYGRHEGSKGTVTYKLPRG